MAAREISRKRHRSFAGRLPTMLAVDFRRMFTMPMFYIMSGIAVVIPVLILVMTTAVSGSGESSMTFTSAWQMIGSLSTDSAAMMDMTSMYNINLLYFMAAVLVCCFVAGDFQSGYAKNLFTVRSRRDEYAISKMIVCFFASALLIPLFFVGTVLGAAIAGLPFTMVGFHVGNLILCLLAKILLMGVFVSIYVVASVAARQRLWLSIIIALMVGMFMFMIIPMMTPLDATVLHVILCLAGSALFGVGLSSASTAILRNASVA